MGPGRADLAELGGEEEFSEAGFRHDTAVVTAAASLTGATALGGAGTSTGADASGAEYATTAAATFSSAAAASVTGVLDSFDPTKL